MTVEGNGSSGTSTTTPSSYNFSESYKIDYASSTTYKVTVTEVSGSTNIVTTVWILKNGTALAIAVTGDPQNITGSEAQDFIIGTFVGFTLQVQADAELTYYTNNGFFHSTGTSTVSIGPTNVKVTNYVANTLPETVDECGQTTTLTAFSLSVGTPSGASSPLVTYEHFAGSDVVNGQTDSFSIVLQVTSITLA
ncbi:MAG: hypothetical protein OK449_10170 [Thaumarchaeota archaeon]|nr:hypothetical protein [Nitrososphaerota archaeon]